MEWDDLQNIAQKITRWAKAAQIDITQDIANTGSIYMTLRNIKGKTLVIRISDHGPSGKNRWKRIYKNRFGDLTQCYRIDPLKNEIKRVATWLNAFGLWKKVPNSVKKYLAQKTL